MYECACFVHHRHSGFYMHVPIGKKLMQFHIILLYVLKYQHKIDHTHIIMWMIRLPRNRWELLLDTNKPSDALIMTLCRSRLYST